MASNSSSGSGGFSIQCHQRHKSPEGNTQTIEAGRAPLKQEPQELIPVLAGGSVELHEDNDCGLNMPATSNTVNHILPCGTSANPYKCDICEEEFIQSGGHMMTHTSKKPRKCNICEKQFTEAHHLKTHMVIHIQEKPHKCDICNKTLH